LARAAINRKTAIRPKITLHRIEPVSIYRSRAPALNSPTAQTAKQADAIAGGIAKAIKHPKAADFARDDLLGETGAFSCGGS
jgi:hypothetical protein